MTADREYRTIARRVVGGNEIYSACAPAKLNITLSIGRKGEDGMHRLSSIMQAITLHDTVTVRKVAPGEEGIEGHAIQNNIVTKAIEELSRHAGMELHCRVKITKAIPMAAGMAGGSSDAAAFLRLANRAYGLDMPMAELERVASRVGSDVPFLLHGGRAKVEGAAEHRITQMQVPDLYYIIARPRMMLSTKEMYALHDKTGKDFTELACSLCPDTRKLIDEVRKADAVESGVTGKGPTVFAAYRTYAECRGVLSRLSWLDGDLFIERPIRALAR